MPARLASSASKTPVDWVAVRERLERAAQALDAAPDTPEKNAAVLVQRARALARPTAVAASETGLEVVAFELGGQIFAIEAALVRESVLPRELTRLPGLPEFVRGLVNVRSRVVAAIDLRPLLHLATTAVPAAEKLLIIESEGVELGLLVESVVGLRTVPAALRRDVPGLDDKYLRGIAPDGTVVLALPALIRDLVVDDASEA